MRVQAPAGELPDLKLDPGETAAIVLAVELDAELLLIDERDGRTIAAERFGLTVA